MLKEVGPHKVNVITGLVGVVNGDLLFSLLRGRTFAVSPHKKLCSSKETSHPSVGMGRALISADAGVSAVSVLLDGLAAWTPFKEDALVGTEKMLLLRHYMIKQRIYRPEYGHVHVSFPERHHSIEIHR